MRILKSRPFCMPTNKPPLSPSAISPEPHSEDHAKLRPCAEQNAHLCPSRCSQVSVPSLTGEEIGLCKSLIQSTLQKVKKQRFSTIKKAPDARTSGTCSNPPVYIRTEGRLPTLRRRNPSGQPARLPAGTAHRPREPQAGRPHAPLSMRGYCCTSDLDIRGHRCRTIP